MTRMKPRRKIAVFSGLIVLGVLIAVFSKAIVLPGLELLLGIETIVGARSVFHQPDGSYLYTNPGAMLKWIASVVGVGLAIAAVGIVGLLASLRKKGASAADGQET